jgi:methyl-accepting chemotaxis protein
MANQSQHTGSKASQDMGKTDQSKESTINRGMDLARDTASSVADKGREMASAVSDRARQVASAAGQRVEDTTNRIAGGMESLASTLRENAPNQGYIGSAASHVADSLESSGRYLRQEGISGITSDLTDLVKRNPLPALFLGIGFGFLLARLTSSSRS